MDTDLELSRFYNDFLKKSLNLNEPVNLKAFKGFLNPIDNAENKAEVKVFKADDYHEKFAHLFENSLFTSSAVAALFKDILEKNDNLFSRLIENDLISICCFSDGTCAEVVAIVLVLANVLESFATHFRFKVTVICCTRSWKQISLNILRSLEKYKIDGEHVQFIDINVSEKLPDEVQQVIKTSKIVTIVKFLSQVQNCQRRFWEVYKDILQQLQPESVVFFLDCAERKFFSGINRQLSSCLKLYHSTRYLHILNFDTVKNNFKPFDGAVENYFLVKSQVICFGFWANVERNSSDAFNVRNMEWASMNLDKSAGERSSVRDKLRRKYISTHNMEESTSIKNNSCSHKSNEPENDTSTTTKSLVRSINYEYKGPGKKKSKLDSKKDKANMTDVDPGHSSKLSGQPFVVSKEIKKIKKEKCRIGPAVDEAVSSIAQPKNQYTHTRGGWKDGGDYRESKIYPPTNLKPSKLLQINGTQNTETMVKQERSLFFSENMQFSQTQGSIENVSQDTLFSKAKCATTKKMHNVCHPENKTFSETGQEIDLKRKKRRNRRQGEKCKKTPSVYKTVPNISEENHSDTPNYLVQQSGDENGNEQGCHPTTTKSSEFQKDYRGQSEKSRTEQEKSLVLAENVGFLQFQNNEDDSTCSIGADKTEFAERDITERSVNKKQHDVSILVGGKLVEESEECDVLQKKKGRKKVKVKSKFAKDKTDSNISEKIHRDTPKVLVQHSKDNNSLGCHSITSKFSFQKDDKRKSKKSLTKQEKEIVLPQTEEIVKDNTWGMATNETKFTECDTSEPYSGKKQHDVFTPENETLFGGSKKGVPQKIKTGKKENCKHLSSVDETVSNVSREKQKDASKELIQLNRDNNGHSSLPITSKSSFQKSGIGKRAKSLAKEEKSMDLSGNIGHMQMIGDVEGVFPSGTMPKKTESSECDITERNLDQKQRDDSIPISETFLEKSEEVQCDLPMKKRRKKEKRKRTLSVDKTVSNTSKQKHPDEPKDLDQQSRDENDNGQSCYPTTTKSLKLYKNDRGQSEKLLREHEELTLLFKNIGLPQTQKNIEDHTWDTVTKKTEFADRDMRELNVDKKLHNVPMPICDEFFDKSKEVEIDPQIKKRGKKEKFRNKHSVCKMVFDISKQKYPDLPNYLVQQNRHENGNDQICLPTTSKSPKLQEMDRNESESLRRQIKSVEVPEGIRFPQTPRIMSSSTCDSVNKDGCAEYEMVECNNDLNLQHVSISKAEESCMKIENIWVRQVEFGQQEIDKSEKVKSTKKPTLHEENRCIGKRKPQDTSKELALQTLRNDDVCKNSLTILKSSKFKKTDRRESENTLTKKGKTADFSKGIQHSEAKRNMDNNARVSVTNAIKCKEYETLECNNDDQQHHVSITKSESSSQRNEEVLTRQVELDRQKKNRKKEKCRKQTTVDKIISSITGEIKSPDQILDVDSDINARIGSSILHDKKKELDGDVVQGYTEFKHPIMYCGLIGKNELFCEGSILKNSLEASDKKQIDNFDTDEKHSFSNCLKPKETCTHQNVITPTSTKKPCHLDRKAPAANQQVEILETELKQQSFTNGSVQKLTENEARSHQNIPVSIAKSHHLFAKSLATSKIKSHHSSQNEQLSENLKICAEKPRNKEENIVCSISGSEPSTEFIVPYHQIGGNLRGQQSILPVSITKKLFPFTKITKPHHSSQTLQLSETKTASKIVKDDAEKVRNKGENIVSSRRGTETGIERFVPAYQTAGNVHGYQSIPPVSVTKKHFPFTKIKRPHHLSQNKLFSDIKKASESLENAGKAKNKKKNILNAKGGAEPDTGIFVPDRQITGDMPSKDEFFIPDHKMASNVCSKEESFAPYHQIAGNILIKEGSVLQATTMVIEKAFNSFDISNTSPRMFSGKRGGEKQIISMTVCESEEQEKKCLQSSFEFVKLPHAQFRKNKVLTGKKKNKKNRPKKGKEKIKRKALKKIVFWHSENLKYELINEDLSLIALAADYSNTFLTKVNLVLREDIVENEIFFETKNPHQNYSSKSNDRILYDCMYDLDDDQASMYGFDNDDLVYYPDIDAFAPAWFRLDSDDDDFDSIVPAFNQSSSKNKRWDYWWKRWNWV